MSEAATTPFASWLIRPSRNRKHGRSKSRACTGSSAPPPPSLRRGTRCRYTHACRKPRGGAGARRVLARVRLARHSALDDLRKYRCGLLDAESRLPEIVQRGSGDRASCRSSAAGRRLWRAHNSWITGQPLPHDRRDFCNRCSAVTPLREAARSHSRGRRRGDGGCGTGLLRATG
jgi:hypothetical protein